MPRKFLVFKILETVPLPTVKIFDDDEDEPEVLGIISIDKYNNLLVKHNEIKNLPISDDQKYDQIRELWFSNTKIVESGLPPSQSRNTASTSTNFKVESEYGVRTAKVISILEKLGIDANTKKIAEECDVRINYVNLLRAKLGISRKRGREGKDQRNEIIAVLQENPEAFAPDVAERFGVSSVYVNSLRFLKGIKGKKGRRIGCGKSNEILLDLRTNSSITKMAIKWEVSEQYIRILMIEKYGSSSVKKLA